MIGRYAAFRCLVCGLLLWTLSGCGSKTSTVSGKVTFKDKPLPSGTVTFFGPNGTVESGEIQPDGTYTIPRAPVGAVQIIVMTAAGTVAGFDISDPTLVQDARIPKPTVKPVPIPPHYGQLGKSGLTYTVESKADQSHHINLAP